MKMSASQIISKKRHRLARIEYLPSLLPPESRTSTTRIAHIGSTIMLGSAWIRRAVPKEQHPQKGSFEASSFDLEVVGEESAEV